MTILEFAKSECLRYLKLAGMDARRAEAWNPTFAVEENGQAYDGYTVEVRRGRLTVTSPKERGILFGVYEYLRSLGFDFLFPEESRMRIPRLPDPLEDCRIVREPVVEYRGLCLYGVTADTLEATQKAIDWMAKNGFNLLLTSIRRADDSVDGCHAILWEQVGEALLPELEKRGVVVDMSEHSTDYFIPRDEWFDRHPEWFSEIDGRRQPAQLCYSNPEAVEEYADAYARFAAKHPKIQFIGVWPLDGRGYCECERCRNPLVLFRAAERVAEKIHAVRPDLVVEFPVYQEQSVTPPDRLPGGMSALVCRFQNKIALDWGLRAAKSGGAFYFEYHTADHYRFRSNVWLNPGYCREMVNTFWSYGYRGVISLYLPLTASWAASINYFFLRRAFYDPCFDWDSVLRELIAALFGTEQEEAFLRIFGLLFDRLQDRALWSRVPFVPDYFEEHCDSRSQGADRLHLRRFQEAYRDLRRELEQLDPLRMEPGERWQLNCLVQYIELQRLFFETVDQYDPRRDTPARVEPYFLKLRELERSVPGAFIPENYARWRVAGRDSILTAAEENPFEAAKV